VALETQIVINESNKTLNEIAWEVGNGLCYYLEQDNDLIKQWNKGQIRKLVKLATDTQFSKLENHSVHRGDIKYYLPAHHEDMPQELKRPRLQGWYLPHENCWKTTNLDEAPLIIAVSPHIDWESHPGKLIAQVSHAFHIAHMNNADQWKKDAYSAYLYWPNISDWNWILPQTDIKVTDAGFTILEPGTLTVAAKWLYPRTK
jgi:hypothetical protein